MTGLRPSCLRILFSANITLHILRISVSVKHVPVGFNGLFRINTRMSLIRRFMPSAVGKNLLSGVPGIGMSTASSDGRSNDYSMLEHRAQAHRLALKIIEMMRIVRVLPQILQ